MHIYKEIKQIVDLYAKCSELIYNLEQKLDMDGFDFHRAYLIKGCTEKNGHLYDESGCKLDNSGIVDNDYYCNQYTGYNADDYYGTLYFKTYVKGVFVAVPFIM